MSGGINKEQENGCLIISHSKRAYTLVDPFKNRVVVFDAEAGRLGLGSPQDGVLELGSIEDETVLLEFLGHLSDQQI